MEQLCDAASELSLGPDRDRVMAVLSLKLAQISPMSRAKLTHCSRTTREVVLEACPLPLQSWVASSNRGILYEEPRAWQAHCYAACWYVQGHQYMEPEVQGCPSVAPISAARSTLISAGRSAPPAAAGSSFQPSEKRRVSPKSEGGSSGGGA